MTITEFLLARIAEDEGVARATLETSPKLLLDWSGTTNGLGLEGPVDGPSGYTSVVIDPARVLAECEAKRRIVERHVSTSDYSEPWDNVCSEETYLAKPDDCEDLRALAAVYADHPDYRNEWRPAE